MIHLPCSPGQREEQEGRKRVCHLFSACSGHQAGILGGTLHDVTTPAALLGIWEDYAKRSIEVRLKCSYPFQFSDKES